MQDHLAVQASAAEQFAALLADGDLGAPVPSCPGWRLSDLADHLGGVHQWATHAVLHGSPNGEPTTAPLERAELVIWYRDAAERLLTALTDADPADPAWTFGAHPRTVAFWRRRQAQETTIHLWDAARSQGSSHPIDAALARDGIDELVTMFFPRQVRLGRTRPLTHSLAIVTNDQDRSERWVLVGDGAARPGDGAAGQDGASAGQDGGGSTAQATVEGPAEALLLLLWRRIGLDDPRLRLTGDEAAAHAVLGQEITP